MSSHTYSIPGVKLIVIVALAFLLAQCNNWTNEPAKGEITDEKLKNYPSIALGFVFGWNQTTADSHFYSLLKTGSIKEDEFEVDALLKLKDTKKPCEKQSRPSYVTIIEGTKFDVKPVYYKHSYLSDSNIFYQLVLKSEGYVIDRNYDPIGGQSGFSKLETKLESLRKLLKEKYQSQELDNAEIVFLQNKIRVKVDSEIETYDLLTCSYSYFHERFETVTKQMGRIIITYTDIDALKQISNANENKKRIYEKEEREAAKNKL